MPWSTTLPPEPPPAPALKSSCAPKIRSWPESPPPPPASIIPLTVTVPRQAINVAAPPPPPEVAVPSEWVALPFDGLVPPMRGVTMDGSVAAPPPRPPPPSAVALPPAAPAVLNPAPPPPAETSAFRRSFPNKITGVPEQIRVLLDSSYLTAADHAALWTGLRAKLSTAELSLIVELNAVP